MRILIVKWVSIALLLVTLLFWSSQSELRLASNLFVAIAALIVGIESLRWRQARWGAAFIAVALIFGAASTAALLNPAVPAFQLGGAIGSLVMVFSIAVFILSFFALPRHSMVATSRRSF
jgi:hypothetical protein